MYCSPRPDDHRSRRPLHHRRLPAGHPVRRRVVGAQDQAADQRVVLPGEPQPEVARGGGRTLRLEHLDDSPGRARGERLRRRHGRGQLRVDGVVHDHPAQPRLRADLLQEPDHDAARVHGAALQPGRPDHAVRHVHHVGDADPHRHQPLRRCRRVRAVLRDSVVHVDRDDLDHHGDLHRRRRPAGSRRHGDDPDRHPAGRRHPDHGHRHDHGCPKWESTPTRTCSRPRSRTSSA